MFRIQGLGYFTGFKRWDGERISISGLGLGGYF